MVAYDARVNYVVTFPDLIIESADMVHTHGVTPSVCMCNCVIVSQARNRRWSPGSPYFHSGDPGDLIFWADGVQQIVFKDAVIRNVYANIDHLNRIRAKVEIVDKRWKWRYFYVSGAYNVRTNGGAVDESTAATWKELFEIVLEALGEIGRHELRLDDELGDPPHVDWSDTRADLALAELCDLAGCIVSLTVNNVVRIETIGAGDIYPYSDTQRVPVVDYVTKMSAKDIIVAFGKTVYQCWLLLEPIGYDEDGNIYSVDKLPWIEWDTFRKYQSPGTPQRDPDAYFGCRGIKDDEDSHRNWYSQCDSLFRVFRIKKLLYEGVYGENKLPDGKEYGSVDDIQLLRHLMTHPMISMLGDTWVDAGRSGDIQEGNQTIGPYIHVESIDMLTHEPYTFFDSYDAHVKIDFEAGTVTFPEFVVNYDDDGYIVLPEVAGIFCFHARDPDGKWNRHEHTLELDSGVGSHIEHVTESVYYIEDGEPGTDDPITNEDTVDKDLGPAIAERVKRRIHSGLPTSWVEWAGIQPFDVRGNVHQMRWFVGKNHVFTQGGKNLEHPTLAPLYKYRRLYERTVDD